MGRINKRELYCGLLLMFIGIGAAIGAQNYSVGSLARMGPGYFPLALGILLTLIGGVIMVTPSGDKSIQNPPISLEQVRTWGLVVVGVVLFVVLGQYAGLVPATFALIFISALGDRETSEKDAALLAAGVTLAAVGIFHYGLQMQFPLVRWG